MEHRWLRRITDSFPVGEEDREAAVKFSQDFSKGGESPDSQWYTGIRLMGSVHQSA